MLMPQELKKYAFNHAIRGYSPAEVDEYIAFLCEKYAEVYRENDELERKLIAALRALDELKGREQKITALESEVKRASAGILAEAEARKKQIVADAEEYADRIIADADARVAQKEQLTDRLRRSVLAFRDELYARYSAQIDQIEALCAFAETDEPLPEEISAPDDPLSPGELGSTEEELPHETDENAEAEEAFGEDASELMLFETVEEDEDEAEAEGDETALRAEIDETDAALMFYDESEEALIPSLAFEEEDGGDYAAPDERFYALFDQESVPAPAEITREIEPVAAEETPAQTAEALLPDGDPADDIDEVEDSDLMRFLEEFTVGFGTPEDADITDITEEVGEAEESGERDESDGAAESDESEETEKSDEDLLRELRQVFDIDFETFTTEESDGDGDGDFAFLPEDGQ